MTTSGRVLEPSLRSARAPRLLSVGDIALRHIGLAAVIFSTLLLAGCIGDKVPLPQNAMDPVTRYGQRQQDLFVAILIPAWVVFIVVEGALLFTIWRFRARPGGPAARQFHGNTRIEIAWTIAPAIVLAVIAIPTVETIFDIGGDPPAGSLPIEVIGHQWWWEFRYPEQNIVTANEVHLPANRVVSFILTSDDVIHAFAIPKLGGRRDAIPGHHNTIWMDTPAANITPADGFWGQCAEFCGTSHANMRMRAFVDTQADFDAWVRGQLAPAATSPQTAQGAQLFQTRCAVCHTVVGPGAPPGGDSEKLLNRNNPGKIGPNLTHLASRKTLAAGIMDNTPENLATWLKDPPAVKPGSLMPNLVLSDQDIQALVAYLGTLK